MINHQRSFVSPLFLLILSWVVLPFPVCAVEDTIVAVVNDDVITLKDYEDYVTSNYHQLQMEGLPASQVQELVDDMKTNGIRRLIEEKLILDKANALGIKIDEAAVNQQIDSMKTRYKSDQEFLDALLADGNTLTDLRSKVRDKIKMKYLINDEIRAKIYVNPQEVTEYYNQHPEYFQKPESRQLESIFIAQQDDKNAAKEKAENIYASVKDLLSQGNDFASLAQKYSEATSIGLIKKGQFLPDIEATVFQLQPKEISPLIETANGYYIFQVKEKFPMEVSSLEEVKKNIYDEIFQIKFQKNFRDWVDELKAKAYIEIKNDSNDI